MMTAAGLSGNLKKRLIVVAIVDATIAATMLALILTRTAPIVPVAVLGMACGVPFNYFILRGALSEDQVEGSDLSKAYSSDRVGLARFAVKLAALSGLGLVVGSVIEAFATQTPEVYLKSVIMIGFGIYFMSLSFKYK